MACILSCGVAVLDFVFSLDELPREAKKYRADDSNIVGGGCAANAAVAVSRLGGESLLVSRLGDDIIGDMIVSGLELEGVDCQLVARVEGKRSSYSSILVDGEGERQIVNFRDKSILESAKRMPIPTTDNFNAVLADNRWPSGAKKYLEFARRMGIPGILDAESPMDAGSEDAIMQASHVAFSSDGLNQVVEGSTKEDQLKTIVESGKRWACVTDGANGVWWTENNQIEHMPAFNVEVVDTLGAGDVWHGAFALALAEGQSEIEAIRFASSASAIKCTRFGGRMGIPIRKEVNDFLTERTH